MKNKKIYGFTLVELIVVITILTILGTIAFISLQGYSKSSRDARRISDIQNIKKSLELFSVRTGKYPLPDNSGIVTLSGELVWTQGFVGEQVTTNLSENLKNKPLDPLLETEYVYSVTNTGKEYQLLFILETNDITFDNDFVEKTYAADYSITKISGTYNEVYVNTMNYFLAIPSIITSEELPLELTLSGAITSQIVDEGDNVLFGGIETVTGALDIDLNYVERTIGLDSTDSDKILAINVLQDTISGTTVGDNEVYQQLLSASSEVEKLELANWIFGGITPGTESFDVLENLQDVIESGSPVEILLSGTDGEIFTCDLCD